MTNKKPIKKFKSQNVEGAIWLNGKTRYCIDFSKRYQKNGEYKTTKVFLQNDLTCIAKIATHAFSWIKEQIEQEELDSSDSLDMEIDYEVVA